MEFLRDLISGPPCPADVRPEVDKLIEEIIRIGKTDDYLSERPSAGFNSQCRHVRGRAIGKRLYDVGGLDLMYFVQRKVRRSFGRKQINIAWHLDYCWDGIGEWKA